MPASRFSRSTTGPIGYALTVLLWFTQGATLIGSNQSQRVWPITCRRFLIGSPRSKGFSPGWVRRIANMRMFLVFELFAISVPLVLTTLWTGSCRDSTSDEDAVELSADFGGECVGNVTVGNVRARWSFVQLRMFSYCCGLRYTANIQTLSFLLMFSIVVELMEASCSDVPLMPLEKKRKKAALVTNQEFNSFKAHIRINSQPKSYSPLGVHSSSLETSRQYLAICEENENWLTSERCSAMKIANTIRQKLVKKAV